MSNISAFILTYNEEQNIVDCINSLRLITDEIYVIDSFSTDKTVELANGLGAIVVQHEFLYHANQVDFALNNIKFNYDWIIRMDADERLTNESASEIEKLISEHNNDSINGIVLRFDFLFMGKKLRHGGVYPFRKLSVFKKGKAFVENKKMDEHFVLTEGKSINAKCDCIHENYKGLFDWIEKHNKYALNECKEYFDGKKNKKRKFYYSLLIFLRAKLLYLYYLIFKFAWLDGRPGLIYAYLHTHWYRYLVDSYIYEQKKKK